jgi:REP element-mobilizing transposase RayT
MTKWGPTRQWWKERIGAGAKLSVHVVWRGKGRKKILKFRKGVENPQIEELRMLRVIF